MDLENDEFKLFAEHAMLNELRYLVIGGFAMYLNGLARNTEDVDIWIDPTEPNGRRFTNTLLGMGYTDDELAQVKGLDFTQPQVFGLNNYLDILTVVHRKFDFTECFQRSRSVKNQYGHTIHFLHLNDLREQKVVARRLQDLRDIVMIDDFIAKAEKLDTGESDKS
jgi:hypothetical protein